MAVIFKNASYIIDENYIVRSFNDAAKEEFPGLEKGRRCYDAIKGFSAPCPDCPLVTKNPSATAIVTDKDNKKLYLSFSNTAFDDGSLGYIVNFRSADFKCDEVDAECSLLKNKADAYRRANYYCAYAYFDCNLSRDVITSDIIEVIDSKEYPVDMSSRGFEKPISFSKYNTWRLGRSILSNRDEYKEMCDTTNLINNFRAGKPDQEIMFRARSTSGFLTWQQQGFYMYKSEFSDDIYALCVLRDLAFKVEGEEKSKRNEEIMKILADEYSTVIYVDLDTEIASFVSLPSFTDKGMRDMLKQMKYPELWNYYINKRVHNSDAKNLEKFSDKEYLKSLIREKSSYSYIYRMGDETNYQYYELKIVKTTVGEPKYIVVGIADKDDAIKTQQEHQRQLESALTLAQMDSLTGIRNRTAYVIMEDRFNKEIADGKVSEFAIVMFDANGLKITNDMHGHEKGNTLLKNTSALICDHFKHSMVYRVGGDEFVAVLLGKDYQNREKLLGDFRAKIEKNIKKGEPLYENVSVASGMAVFEPGSDNYVEDVFKRADSLMYENKKEIKSRK